MVDLFVFSIVREMVRLVRSFQGPTGVENPCRIWELTDRDRTRLQTDRSPSVSMGQSVG